MEDSDSCAYSSVGELSPSALAASTSRPGLPKTVSQSCIVHDCNIDVTADSNNIHCVESNLTSFSYYANEPRDDDDSVQEKK